MTTYSSYTPHSLSTASASSGNARAVPHQHRSFVSRDWRFLRKEVTKLPPSPPKSSRSALELTSPRLKRFSGRSLAPSPSPSTHRTIEDIECSINTLERALGQEEEKRHTIKGARKTSPKRTEVDSASPLESRPSSPVVLWRSSSGVKLATNVPQGLLQNLNLDADQEQDIFGFSWDANDAVFDILRYDESKSKSKQVAARSIDKKKKRRSTIIQDVWCIDHSKWKLEGSKEKRHPLSGNERSWQAPSKELDAKEAKLSGQLPSLFISKSYRDWLCESNGLRIPRYLENITYKKPPKSFWGFKAASLAVEALTRMEKKT